MSRPLSAHEAELLRWMLHRGGAEGRSLLPQVDRARVAPWRCPCGCASFNLEVGGAEAPPGEMRVVADFVVGEGAAGIFVFARGGVLAGVEVYGLAGDPPHTLPDAEDLRPFP